MSYGLLNNGFQKRSEAMAGMRQSAQDEQQRNIANDNIAAQESAAKKANASAGATMGAVAGTQAASSAIAGGTAAATTGTMLASGLATGGIGLIAGLALSELL